MKRHFQICSLSVTDHAEKRFNQRGLRRSDLEFLIENSDIITDVGGGSVAYSLSQKGVDSLEPEDRHRPEARKAAMGAVIVNGLALVTAVTLDNASKEKSIRQGRRKDGHPHRPRGGNKKKTGFDVK